MKKTYTRPVIETTRFSSAEDTANGIATVSVISLNNTTATALTNILNY